MQNETSSTTTNKFISSKTSEKKLDLYEFFINDDTKNKEHYNFKDNEINTKKYNIITFLPKALLIQFLRLANVYFLICAILQCIPIISPIGPETAVIPFIIVIAVSIIREGIEDLSRAKLDKEQNIEPTEIYIDNQWEQTQSGKLHMGNIVSVKQDDTFPADLILIDSDLPEGICFIETGSLDGEKTLKFKEAPKQTAGKFNKKGEKHMDFIISGNALADQPNPELYSLNGKMHLIFTNMNKKGKKEIHDIPLDAKQLLLKGAKLKNTSWIIGIVVYTGHNCKIMKNAKDPVTKMSSVESLMNIALILIFILQAIFCIISAILRGYYYIHNYLETVDGGGNYDEINKLEVSFGYTIHGYHLESFLNFFTYLLLLNTMIPISLIITLEIIKLIQGVFMKKDAYCYSKIRKKWLTPNSISLNEECGLVNYIFSDKTGTLTCNKMIFKYCVIGDICYEYLRTDGNGSIEDMDFRDEENILTFHKYEMFESILDENKIKSQNKYKNYIIKSTQDKTIKLSLENHKDLIEHFWYGLSLCHSCTIQSNPDETEDYICISPDSIELVKTAKDQGWRLIESGSNSIKRIRLGKDGLFRNDIERLQLIEFSSDRKRETVIVKDRGLIKVYVKGADSIIEQRLSKKTPDVILKQCKYYVNKFSSQGFRTLFIAMKILSQKEYDDYSYKLKQAQMSENDKDKKVEEVNNIIENDLYLIGTTIVEDKLQDKVPETIKKLRISNIKIWMLTGDKMNTAYNIGLSCNLINKNMKIFSICGIEQKKNENLEIINKEEQAQVILNFAKEFSLYKGQYNSLVIPQFGILVDEKALLTINEDIEIQNIFLNIAKDATSVICCRVSPLQKSQVVKMMKNFDKKGITLAIGDGGNDVSMIMEAHIGVGIYGEEGMRAVQSSDYALGEFQFLAPLLFCHGRINYIRNAECIEYFFYKNFVFTLVQFLYGFYCNFSGQTIIDDWFITTYNLIFTALPLAGRALLDQDLKRDDGDIVNKMLPFMFKENRDNPIFTLKNFSLNMLKGIIHCLINFFLVIYSLQDQCFDEKGNIPELWTMSVLLYTNMLIIVSEDLFIFTRYHTWINFVLIFGTTFLLYIGFVFLVHNFSYFNSVGTMLNTFNSSKIWFILIFIVGTCLLIDFTILAIDFTFNKNITTMLQLIYNVKGEINEEEDIPEIIKEKLKLYKNNEEEKNKDLNEIKKIDDITSKNDLINEKNNSNEKSSINSDNTNNKIKNSFENDNSKGNENKNKLKSKNKKINEKSFSSNNSMDSNSLLSNKSKIKSSVNSSNKSSNKKSYSSKYSNTNSDNIDDDEDDIPKKTMEYMNNKNTNIKKINESDDFDDIGENYEDEFSEKIDREVKYFNPKQSTVPSLLRQENKNPRNGFTNYK